MITLASKYKVIADDQFLGHYYATSPERAVEKAVDATFVYYPTILGMSDCEFVAQRGVLSEPVSLHWTDVPEVAGRYEIPLEVI